MNASAARPMTSKPMITATVRWTHSIQALASSSGGMIWPWQSGQSGQPNPEPVARTITPIVTSRMAVTTVAAASFWNRVTGLLGGVAADRRDALHSSVQARVSRRL
jgi:hypothetical protein